MAVGEVGRAEADDTGTVTRRTECCTDDCGAERGHTTDVAWPRKVVVGWIDIDGGESDRWRMAVGEGRGVGDCDDDVLVMAKGGEEADEVGRDRAEMKVVAVGEVAGILARRAVYCGGDGGGERGHSADSDGLGLECECGTVPRGGWIVGCWLGMWDFNSCSLRPRTPRKC